MKKLKVTKLHGTFLAMNLLPIILMGLVITIFSANRFAASMYHEVQGGLKDLCNTIQVTIDELYPGAYHVEETEDAKSATTSSTGGLVLALKRAFLLLAQKGGIASTFTGPL